MLRGKQEREHVGRGRPFTDTLDDAIAYFLRLRGKFGIAPPLAKETDERASRTAFEVVVGNVVGEGEFEDTGDSAGTLSATAATDAPLCVGDALVFVKFEKGVVETVEHLVDYASLGFVVEMGK